MRRVAQQIHACGPRVALEFVADLARWRDFAERSPTSVGYTRRSMRPLWRSFVTGAMHEAPRLRRYRSRCIGGAPGGARSRPAERQGCAQGMGGAQSATSRQKARQLQGQSLQRQMVRLCCVLVMLRRFDSAFFHRLYRIRRNIIFSFTRISERPSGPCFASMSGWAAVGRHRRAPRPWPLARLITRSRPSSALPRTRIWMCGASDAPILAEQIGLGGDDALLDLRNFRFLAA